jgi:CubicO group peptidase (beta-lactamase class C family)
LAASLVFNCIFLKAQQKTSAENSLTSIIDGLQTKLQKDIADDTLEGSISVAIVHKNQIIWSKAFGYADRENKIYADTSTIYRIASLTKPFTATLMMQLIEKGVLKLNDPVEIYLPEIKKLKGYSEANKITFFQLATHTAGLEREPELEDARKGAIENWENKVLECIPATAIETTPGKNYKYSNIGYAILGLALERAAKEPYTKLITENIFMPLQMENSSFIISPSKKTNLAKGLTMDSGKLKQLMPLSTHGYTVPAGGIYSTANDLTKFLMANMGFYSLCTDESRALMQTGVKPPLPFLEMEGITVLTAFLFGENKRIARTALHSKYGIGLSIYTYKETKIVEHSGLLPGYSSQFSFDTKSQYGVILLRNYTEGKTNLHTFSFEVLEKLKSLDKVTK